MATISKTKLQNFIDGESVDAASGETEEVTNPANGEVIADSKNAVVLEEGSYPPVYYFPRQDVKTDRLVRSVLQTYCPFKGDAAYYSFKGGAENAVWTYEHPYDEMHAIKERLAFYPNKVDSIAVL